MPRSYLILTLLALSSLIGCASGSKGDAASGGAGGAGAGLPPVPAGQSRIVFYRTSSAIGSLDKPSVFSNGFVIGKSESGTYSYADVAPGAHAIECKGGGGDTADANRISVQTTAGATTYIETSVKPGINSYKVSVQEKSESEAKPKLAKLKLHPPSTTPPPPAPAATPATRP